MSPQDKPQREVAVLAGGCFWGVEEILRAAPGVIDTHVGYTGGRLENPTYEDTHDGKSGHAEAIRVTFDPSLLSPQTLEQSTTEEQVKARIEASGKWKRPITTTIEPASRRIQLSLRARLEPRDPAVTHGANQDRRPFVVSAAAAIIGLELGMPSVTKSLVRQIGAVPEGGLSALRHASAWLNSPPLTAEGLRGKVVLVDFCTYTCVNWLRTLPYLRAWDAKYRPHGLVVIGVHTPEFGFEHDLDNVGRAIKAMRVEYPVAVDNDYAIWNGFANQYWPALYLIDEKGAIRFTHFGEGAYDESERMIQKVLGDLGAKGLNPALVTVDARGLEVAADWDNLRSPENYLGSVRTEGFRANRHASRLGVNQWALDGDWKQTPRAVALNKPNGCIVYRFHARDLNLVMGPAARGASVRFRVRIEGQPAGGGTDVDTQGNGVVTEQRTYQLIRQAWPIVDRQFEIEFLDPGIEAFCFTFG